MAAGSSPVCDEVALLGVFADFAELSRNRPVGQEAHDENRVHSPREHFHTFLRSLDIPWLAQLRDTQNYTHLAAHGLSLWDVPPHKVDKDLAQWRPVLDWLGR